MPAVGTGYLGIPNLGYKSFNGAYREYLGTRYETFNDAYRDYLGNQSFTGGLYPGCGPASVPETAAERLITGIPGTSPLGLFGPFGCIPVPGVPGIQLSSSP